MGFEHKANSGSLWKNDERKTDKHPNARGSALIDGVEYWVSAWTNKLDDGRVYQSLKFDKKDAETGDSFQSKPDNDFSEFEGDDIPF